VALAASLIVIEAIILSASRAALGSTGIALAIMIIADRISSTRSGVGKPAGISLIALGVLIAPGCSSIPSSLRACARRAMTVGSGQPFNHHDRDSPPLPIA
jgi:hypothetical protein